MFGSAPSAQLLFLLLLFGYGKNGGSNASRNSGSPSNSRYISGNSTYFVRGHLNYSDSPNSVPLGDRALKLRPMAEWPFDPSQVLLPTSMMLRKLKVRALDGTHFSERQPRNPLRDQVILHYPLTKIPAHIRKFVRRFMRKTFRNTRPQHKKTAHALKIFLNRYSACPVKYKWHDFGIKYWPRWVRLGACINRNPSCSVPPGMRCQPDRIRTLRILRYLCPLSWERSACEWRALNFEVLESCSCSC